MGKCRCVDCRQFIGVAGVPDGIYQRDVQNGAVIWFGLAGLVLADATLIAALNAGYATATQVHCSLYENQTNAETRYYLFEEVNVDDQQPTGLLVQSATAPDGTVTYTNLNTGVAYDPAADAATTLTKSEDSDYELVQVPGCDAGVSIERRDWVKAGDSVPVSSAVVDLATGAVHVLSGAETWGGYCVAGTGFSAPVMRCAKVRDANGDIAPGTPTTDVFEVVEQNSATGVPVGVSLYLVSDNSAVVEGSAAGEYFVDRGCC